MVGTFEDLVHSVNVNKMVIPLGGGGDTSILHACLNFLHLEVVGTKKPSLD